MFIQGEQNQINFPSQGCSLRKPLLQELALLNSQPKSGCFCGQQPHGGALQLTPRTDPSENDHWQPSWWVSNTYCNHILHADPKEVPVCPGLHCCSPTTHTHPPCVLQFLHPIGAGESLADVLRQQSLRRLGLHHRVKSSLRTELSTL